MKSLLAYRSYCLSSRICSTFIALLPALVLCLIGLTASCSRKDKDAIAQVGSVSIRAQDFKEFLSKRSGVELSDDQRRALLDQFVDETVFAIEAEEQGLARSKDIQQELSRHRRQILSRAMQEKIVADQLGVEKLREYFDGHKSEFTQKLVSTRLIRISVNAGSDTGVWDKAAERAQEAAKRASKGEDFTALVRRYSDHEASREQGGLTGWSGPSGKIPPEVYVQALRLNPGEVSRPIKARDGYYVIRLQEPVKEMTTPFEEAKENIRLRLRWKILNEEKARLRAKHRVEITSASTKPADAPRKARNIE